MSVVLYELIRVYY